MAGWMKWQIFIPILLLQFINLFWYVLIWRILWRYVFSFSPSRPIPQVDLHRRDSAVMSSSLEDERSDDEGGDDDDEDSALKKKKRS